MSFQISWDIPFVTKPHENECCAYCFEYFIYDLKYLS